MNSRSIRQLKNKFIKMFMVAIILVMVFMGALINGTNYVTSQRLIYNLLTYIVENDGQLAESDKVNFDNFSTEYHYSARYFTAIVDEDGDITTIKTNQTSKIDETAAASYTNRVFSKRRIFGYGRLGSYYYRIKGLDDGSFMIVFLDCTTQILAIWRIAFLTIIICGAGLVLTYALLHRFSDYIIQPELESMEKQKQFITNASHELKTPLAVIRANTEVEEMINGESEWTQSTMNQVVRLNGLIQNLVMITRSQEAENRGEMQDIDISRIVQESVDPFMALAMQEEKALICDIAPDVHMIADASYLQQLVSLLVDNAIKYCDEKGEIRIGLITTLSRSGTWKKEEVLRLTVSNTYAEGKDVDYSRFFDRFYRADQSHNTDRGGYGIGLSVVESICQKYKGKVSAAWKDGVISFICELPMHAFQAEK